MNSPNTQSDKNYLTTGLLAILLGTIGAHRFYLGKIGSGLAMLFTLGGFGLWTLIDVILILTAPVKDSKGQTVAKDPKASKTLYAVAGIFLLMLSISSIGGRGQGIGKPMSFENQEKAMSYVAGTYGDIFGYPWEYKDGAVVSKKENGWSDNYHVSLDSSGNFTEFSVFRFTENIPSVNSKGDLMVEEKSVTTGTYQLEKTNDDRWKITIGKSSFIVMERGLQNSEHPKEAYTRKSEKVLTDWKSVKRYFDETYKK